MPSPTRKRVSDAVMQAIADAITAIENSSDMPRTKRQIEAITGRLTGSPVRAASRSTTWIQGEPASAKTRAWATGSSP